jgi:outer membrane lipoprotein carrier protein
VKIENVIDLNNAIKENSEKVFSIKSDFIQQKNLSMLEETLESTGNFLYKKENMVKWHYSSPFEYTIVVANGKFQINNEGKISEFDLNSNEMFRQINSMIVTAISGNFINNPNFKVEFYENNEFYKAKLIPKETVVADMLSAISIFFDKDNFNVQKVKFLEPGEDFTLITFINRKQNTDVKLKDFNIN